MDTDVSRHKQIIEELTIKLQETKSSHIQQVKKSEEEYQKSIKSLQEEHKVAQEKINEKNEQINEKNEQINEKDEQIKRKKDKIAQLQKREALFLENLKDKNLKAIGEHIKKLEWQNRLELFRNLQ